MRCMAAITHTKKERPKENGEAGLKKSSVAAHAVMLSKTNFISEIVTKYTKV